MEHVVFFPGHDGNPAFRRFASLDEAVRFVEHLRNAEGVAEVSVHALSSVPLAFRAYYKVEVPAGEMPVETPVVPEQPTEAPVEPIAVESGPVLPESEPMLVEAAPVEASSNGKRSLGFFAH